jgi:hypothetical protein
LGIDWSRLRVLATKPYRIRGVMRPARTLSSKNAPGALRAAEAPFRHRQSEQPVSPTDCALTLGTPEPKRASSDTRRRHIFPRVGPRRRGADVASAHTCTAHHRLANVSRPESRCSWVKYVAHSRASCLLLAMDLAIWERNKIHSRKARRNDSTRSGGGGMAAIVPSGAWRTWTEVIEPVPMIVGPRTMVCS